VAIGHLGNNVGEGKIVHGYLHFVNNVAIWEEA